MNVTSAEQKQYSRHLLLEEVGVKGQVKLKQAKVLVIGAGGLGCPILQYLTAAGIGRIGIVDNDTVSQSNLQRQVIYTQEDIGKNKASTAAKRMQLLNPFIQFDVFETQLNTTNALKLFKPYDIIVDGTDNFPSRYLINDAAVILNKPVVFGSIHKFSGQVSTFNFSNGPTYRCLYPTAPAPNEVPNCSEIGVLGVLPGIIGSFQANEVIKMVLGLGSMLSGKLLIFDALSMNQTLLEFKKNISINITELQDDYDVFCGIKNNIAEISLKSYKENSSNYNVLDVRTQKERDISHINSIHIPLDELTERYEELPTDKPLMIYCQSGIRSKRAVTILREHGFKQELVSLKGGIN